MNRTPLILNVALIGTLLAMAPHAVAFQELTGDGVPTEAFRKTFVWFNHTHEGTFFQLDGFKVPYRTRPSITAEQFAEYQKSGKMPYYLSTSLRREGKTVSDGAAHFVIQDGDGKVLVRESVPLETLDQGYWGDLPGPGQYTVWVWTKREDGVVFGGSRKANLAWPPDTPPQILELTADGIPTEESQKTFIPFGQGYYYDPATPDANMYFNERFGVASVSEDKLQEYRKNGRIPFYFRALMTALTIDKESWVDPEALVNFAILDKDWNVIVRDSMPLEKESAWAQNVLYSASYGGDLPKEGRYTLIVWSEMESGVIFGVTKKDGYFVLPSPKEDEESRLRTTDIRTQNKDLRGQNVKPPKAVSLAAITHPIFDSAAIIERIRQEEHGDERKKAMMPVYISMLEKYRDEQILTADKEEGTDREGFALLRFASDFGHLDIVEALIDAGVNLDTQNSYGETALSCAADRGHLDVVEALLAAGADVERNDVLSKTASTKHVDIVKALLAAGANVNETALRNAISWGEVETVELLLAAGADVNAQGGDGTTALMSASRGYQPGSAEKALMLIAAGAKVNLQDKGGTTALMHIARWARTNELAVMLAAGADTELRDNTGRSAMMMVADEGHMLVAETITILIAAGANVNTRDNERRTPLICALDFRNTNIGGAKLAVAETLIAAGAHIDAKDNSGQTALDYVMGTEVITPDTKDLCGKLGAEQKDKLIDLLTTK